MFESVCPISKLAGFVGGSISGAKGRARGSRLGPKGQQSVIHNDCVAETYDPDHSYSERVSQSLSEQGPYQVKKKTSVR